MIGGFDTRSFLWFDSSWGYLCQLVAVFVFYDDVAVFGKKQRRAGRFDLLQKEEKRELLMLVIN